MTERAGCLKELADVFVWKSVPWKQNAACQDKPTWWWFYELSGKDGKHEARIKAKAKGICSQCPVRWRCLAQYMEEESGTFGGYDRKERQAIRDSLSKKYWHNKEAIQAWLGLDEDDITIETHVSVS